jgi:DNA repair exonuclease SbcCD ATPase subunit
LDALEAQHPGVLREILIEHLDRYYDHDLEQEVETAIEQYRDKLADAEVEIVDQFSAQIADIDDQRKKIAAAFDRVNRAAEAAYRRAVMEADKYRATIEQARGEIGDMEGRLVGQAEAMLAQMRTALSAAVPDPNLYDWPECCKRCAAWRWSTR